MIKNLSKQGTLGQAQLKIASLKYYITWFSDFSYYFLLLVVFLRLLSFIEELASVLCMGDFITGDSSRSDIKFPNHRSKRKAYI